MEQKSTTCTKPNRNICKKSVQNGAKLYYVHKAERKPETNVYEAEQKHV